MPNIISPLALFLLFISVGLSFPAQAAEISYGTFIDASRDNRNVPYKIYAPNTINDPAPVVIFSHGLGGSVEAAPYLGEALAENGYIAFFIQHPGTDRSLREGAKDRADAKKMLSKSMRDPGSAANRYADLPFVIDELEKLNEAPGPLKGKMDLARLGMAGHSYGARSVMIAAGEKIPLTGTKFKEPRIKAAIPLSPNPPQRFHNKEADSLPKNLYAEVDIPLFHVTGTKDGHPFEGDFDPATRTVPYQNVPANDQYLLVLDGAEHSTFGGGRRKMGQDGKWQQQVASGAVLFFDAYLKGDNAAKQKLRKDYKDTLSPADRFEFR